MRYRTTSVEATRDLAAALAGLAGGGDLVLLAGEMGVGKTAFAQGFAARPGRRPTWSPRPPSPSCATTRAASPCTTSTCTASSAWPRRIDLGLPELLDGPGVTLIEWGDVVATILPGDFLEVRVAFGEDDDERLLELRVVGPSWAARQRVLGEALEAWKC